MAGIRIPKEPPAQPKAVQSGIVLRLVETAATNGPEWARARNLAMLFFLRDSGCRVSGLINSSVNDYDPKKGWIMVKEKGGETRPVFLSELSRQAISLWLEWRNTLNIREDKLFLSMNGIGLTRGGCYKMLRNLADKAGIQSGERFNPHAFRHAFARDAIENGLDLSRLSQILGHKSIDVTNRYYSRWDKNELKKAHKKFTPAQFLPSAEVLGIQHATSQTNYT